MSAVDKTVFFGGPNFGIKKNCAKLQNYNYFLGFVVVFRVCFGYVLFVFVFCVWSCLFVVVLHLRGVGGGGLFFGGLGGGMGRGGAGEGA